MTEEDLKQAERFARMISPCQKEVKLALINKLSADLLKGDEKGDVDMSIFDGLSNSWDDGLSVEEETEKIRAARVQGASRMIGTL